MFLLSLNLLSHLMCLSQAVPISYFNWQDFNYQSYRESPTRPTARPQKWAYYQAAPSSRTAASPQFRPRTKVRTDAQFMNQQGWPQNFAHNSHPRFNPTFPPRSSMRPPTYPPATYPPATYPPTNPPTSYNSVPPPGSQSVTPPSRQLTASTPNVSLNTTRLGPEIKIIPTEQPRRIQPYSLVPVVTSLPRVTVVTSPTFSVVTSPTNLVVKSSIIPLVVSSSDSVVTKSSQTDARTDAQFMNQQGWPQHLAHNSHPRFNPTFPPRSSTYPPTNPPATYPPTNPPATYPPTNPPTSYNSVPPPGSQSVTPPSRQLTASTPNVSLNTTRLGPEIKMFPTEQPRRIQPYSLVPVVTSLPRVRVVTSPTFSVVTSPTNLVVKSSIIPLVVSSSDSVVTKSSQTVPSVGVSKFSNTATDYHKQDKDKPNPCASSQCGPHANCSPFLETYMCSCTAGYTGAPPSIPCEPIDHCSQAVSPCGTNTVCNSTLTGHLCQCLAGYFTMNTTVYSCMDVDECSSVLALCGANSSCANTVGSFKCGCAKGFSKRLSGGECQENVMERTVVSNYVIEGESQDVDECTPGQDDCGDFSTCSTTENGYACTCLEGFLINMLTSSCEDINECEEKEACGLMASCNNTKGGHECLCQTGYAGNPLVECRDVDECSSSLTFACGPNADCLNTEGGFECQCQEFHEGNPPGTVCTYNCAAKCGDNSECVLTGEGEECACKEGYAGAPPFSPCLYVDECLELPCGANAVCQNTDPGYSCTCESGYEGDANAGCNMVYMCSTPLDCATNKTCRMGTCECKAGFYPEDFLCLDKDECNHSPDICSENSDCKNIVGGYLCLCQPGFDRYPPSYYCTTENKCKRDCGEHSKCEWLEEWQLNRCVCDEGFVELLTGGCM